MWLFFYSMEVAQIGFDEALIFVTEMHPDNSNAFSAFFYHLKKPTVNPNL